MTELALALKPRPTALFAGNNRITIGVLRALAATESALALVCFDDLELADLLSVSLAAVSYDPAELGREAAELLLQRLEGDSRPPQRVILPTTLVVHGSAEVHA